MEWLINLNIKHFPIDNFMTIYTIAGLVYSPECLGGEIGRRTGLKIPRLKGRTGSIPV